MDLPSQFRKRGPEDQLDKQIANSEPENTKRSKSSLESILEPVPTVASNFISRPPHLAVSNNYRAYFMSDHHGHLSEQQNKNMMNNQSRQEGEELSGSVVHESMIRQDSQTPVNGNTGHGSITNNDNMLAVPRSTSNEDQELAFYDVGSGGSGNHTLFDYQRELILLEQQQNRKRALMKTQEKQDFALETITSLPDQLKIAHTSVKDLLENPPAYFRIIEDLKHSITADIDNLQSYEKKLDIKGAEVKALEIGYDDLIQITPYAQQEELLGVKDKAMVTIRQEWESIRWWRDGARRRVEGKNERIAAIEGAIDKAREMVPEMIENLKKLAPELRNVCLR